MLKQKSYADRMVSINMTSISKTQQRDENVDTSNLLSKTQSKGRVNEEATGWKELTRIRKNEKYVRSIKKKNLKNVCCV